MSQARMIGENAVEDGALVPAPLRWTKRWLVICTLVLAGMAVGWVIWAHIARRRLQEQIDAIVARHEPLYLSDFKRMPVAVGQNAAAYLRAAYTALSTFPPRDAGISYKEYPPFSSAWRRQADACALADAGALALVRKASGCAKADWFVPPDPLFHGADLQNWRDYGGLHSLAHVLEDTSVNAHIHHDDAEAIAQIEDLLHMSDAIVQGRPDRLREHTAIDAELDALHALEIIAPDLEVASEDASVPAGNVSRAVTRTEVQRLITRFLRDDAAMDAARRIVFGERALLYDLSCRAHDSATILRPLVDLRAAHMLNAGEPALTELRAPRPTSEPALYPPNPQVPMLVVLSSLLTGYVDLPVLGDAPWLLRVQANRHAAAVMLAVRLFHIDRGRWPDNLAELVPTYLPAVQEDPEIEHATIGYVIERGGLPDNEFKNGSDRPLLFYSPAAGADPGLPPAEPVWQGATRNRPRWYDLARWAPATQPGNASSQ